MSGFNNTLTKATADADYVPFGQRAITDLDPSFSTLTGLARLQAAATAAAAAKVPLYVFNNYTIATWVIPANIPSLKLYGTITQAATGANLLNVSACRGMKLWAKDLEGIPGLVSASSNNAIYGIGNGTDYDSGPSDIVIETGTYIHGFRYFGISLAGAERILVEDGVETDGCWGDVDLTGCSGKIGRMTAHDDSLSLPSSVFASGIRLNSTDGNSYPVNHDVVIDWPTVRNKPGFQAVLAHCGKRIVIRAICNQVFEGVGTTTFNMTDLMTDIDVSAEVTLITPWNVLAASWLAGVATLTIGTSLAEDGDGLHFAIGQPVTLAGFTPAGWNGSFTVASVNWPTVTLTMVADPTSPVTVLGTAGFTVSATGANVCFNMSGDDGISAQKIFDAKLHDCVGRNGNAMAQRSNWGAAHIGWSVGLIECDNEFSNTFGCGVNITNPITKMNVGRGDVIRAVNTAGGQNSGVQMLASADGSSGTLGGFAVDTATYIAQFLGAQGGNSDVAFTGAQGVGITGTVPFNGMQRVSMYGVPTPTISVMYFAGFRIFIGTGAPADATILAATGVSPGNGDWYLRTDGSPSAGLYMRFSAAWHALATDGLSLNNGVNIAGTGSTGNKLGTATSQKWGFWNATPIIQPTRAGQLTDNSGGTGGGNTIAVIGGAVDPTAATVVSTANAIATLAARLNSIEAKLSAAAGGSGMTA